MTDFLSPLLAGNGFRESVGQRLCRSRRQRLERSAGLFACSPRCDCAVSFQRRPRSALWSVLSGLAAEPVSVKTAVDIFAESASCESASESTVLARWRIAGPAIAA